MDCVDIGLLSEGGVKDARSTGKDAPWTVDIRRLVERIGGKKGYAGTGFLDIGPEAPRGWWISDALSLELMEKWRAVRKQVAR